MYFLDFDRTLFDTNAFIEYLRSRSGTEHIFTEGSKEPILQTLGLLSESGALSFTAGELSRFVYPDVPEFLRTLGNEAAIVTRGNPEFQRMKIASALFGIPRVSALYVGEEPKGPFLALRHASYGGVQIFTDDRPIELESVSEHCPSIRLFEIRRDGASGDGRWPVIRSLSELP